MPEFYSGIFFILIFTISACHICYIYPMRLRFLFVLAILMSVQVFSQDDLFAKEYFENGDFEKAIYEYKKLYQQSPSNINYINQIVSSYQQLERYDDAEKFLLQLLERIKYPAFYVELGYNYQLKGDLENANS